MADVGVVESSEVALKLGAKKETNDLALVEDESNNINLPILSPLKSVTVTYKEFDTEKSINIDEDLKRSFTYLSRTKGLELGTKRTDILEEVVRKMLGAEIAKVSLKGEQLPFRVVIMNKGTEPEAFVYPDGSIFISQSLINKMDSFDEVGAVLAHELGHLLNKTYEKSVKNGGLGSVGVSWLHEGVGDMMTLPLQEQAGLNSLAFASAIEKISGTERGIVHQSGLSRAAETVGGHLSVDFSTSNQEAKPLPAEFRSEVYKTNLEIANKLIEKGDYSVLSQILGKLHPEDLNKLYSQAFEVGSWDKRKNELLKTYNEFLLNKIKSLGFSEEEALLALIADRRNDNPYRFNNFYLIRNKEDALTLFRALPNFLKGERLNEIRRQVFNSPEYNLGQRLGIVEEVAKSVREECINEAFLESKENLNLYNKYFISENRIPVDNDSVIEIAQIINQLENEASDISQIYNINSIIFGYIDKNFLLLPSLEKMSVDEDQVRSFVRGAIDQGVEFDQQILSYHIGSDNKEKRGFSFINNEQVSPEVWKIYRDNLETMRRIITEESVQVIETEEKIDFIGIDRDFARIEVIGNKSGEIRTLLNITRRYLDREEISDEDRWQYLRYIDKKLAKLNINTNVDLTGALQGTERNPFLSLTKEKEEQNLAIYRFVMRLASAMTILQNDSPEFYQHVRGLMENSGIDISQYSRLGLMNLCASLLHQGDYCCYYRESQNSFEVSHVAGKIKVQDYERLMALPFVKELIMRNADLGFTSLSELNQYAVSEAEKAVFVGNGKIDLYTDTLFSLLFGEKIRNNFEQILAKGITVKDYDQLFNYLNRFYPEGVLRDEFLRGINKKYLESAEISLREKWQYLVTFFDNVGPEGMAIVASQITDLETYKEFRQVMGARIEKYLSGGSLVNKAAGADLATAFFARTFEGIFSTCLADRKNKEKSSTSLANVWVGTYLLPFWETKGGETDYNPEEQKFIVRGKARATFRTLSDLMTNIKTLPVLQRFSICHKALTEQNGAFSSYENRSKLANILIKSLGIRDRFITSVLNIACREGDAKLLDFPVSNMIAPLLFRAYEINSVNLTNVMGEEHYQHDDNGESSKTRLRENFQESEIEKMFRSSTREAILIGAEYKGFPNSFPYLMSGESDNRYHNTTELLRKMFNEEQNGSYDLEQNTPTEAIIRGVEASGALGVRSLQLATQLNRFSPELAARLSMSFDSNPGLNKLFFWENLLKKTQENPQLAEFMTKVEIGDYLGGGSLFTTYAAAVEENGEKRRIVIKMLNPNAAAFVCESYKLSHSILKKVSRHPLSRKFANMGMMLTDLSHQWCLKDINDQTFMEDDQLFRLTIERFNQSLGQEVFYAPKVNFNSTKVKSEEQAEGVTLNKYLGSSEIALTEKQQVLDLMCKFFIHQVNNPVSNDHFIIHSDPHVGNYIVDQSEKGLRVGVIDRSMYLHLEQADIDALKPLISDADYTGFVNKFVERMLDINKVQGRMQRLAIWTNVWAGVGAEFGRQKVSGQIDKFALLRTLMTKLNDAHLEIPLEHRLMIRNIGAIKELMDRHGLDIKNYL